MIHKLYQVLISEFIFIKINQVVSKCDVKSYLNLAKMLLSLKANSTHIFQHKLSILLSFQPLHEPKLKWPGPSCSKLTTSLAKVLLKFQMLVTEISQYLFLKNVRSFCSAVQKPLSFFQQKISVYLVIES